MKIKQNETNKCDVVCQTLFFPFVISTRRDSIELLFQIVKIFIRIYHHMAGRAIQ